MTDEHRMLKDLQTNENIMKYEHRMLKDFQTNEKWQILDSTSIITTTTTEINLWIKSGITSHFSTQLLWRDVTLTKYLVRLFVITNDHHNLV
jgi:hypothetical protein